jgi:hypothetical protein
MYEFCVCAVFKNESHILEEWLLHYIYRGIDHFYLVNDNSTDDYKYIIDKIHMNPRSTILITFFDTI